MNRSQNRDDIIPIRSLWQLWTDKLFCRYMRQYKCVTVIAVVIILTLLLQQNLALLDLPIPYLRREPSIMSFATQLPQQLGPEWQRTSCHQVWNIKKCHGSVKWWGGDGRVVCYATVVSSMSKSLQAFWASTYWLSLFFSLSRDGDTDACEGYCSHRGLPLPWELWGKWFHHRDIRRMGDKD